MRISEGQRVRVRHCKRNPLTNFMLLYGQEFTVSETKGNLIFLEGVPEHHNWYHYTRFECL